MASKLLDQFVSENQSAQGGSKLLASFVDENTNFKPKAEKKEKALLEKGGAGQTTLESYGNTATMGYLPHLQAGAEKVMTPVLNAITGNNVEVDDYVKSRDENIARQAQQAKENPKANALGVGLGIGSMLLPVGAASNVAKGIGGSIAKATSKLAFGGQGGATALSRIGSAAKTGAMYGAASNPGDVEGELSPVQLEKRAKNAGKGAIIGGVVQGGFEALSPLAKKVAEYFGNKAALKGNRALGRATPNQAKEMARTGQDVEIGRELLDQKAIPFFGTPKRIQKRVEALKEKTWESVDELLSKGGDDAVVDGAEVGVKLLESEKFKLLKQTPGAESAVASIEKAAETLANNGNMTLKQAQAIKKSIDKQINYNKAIPDMTGGQEARFAARTQLRDQMDTAVSKLGSKEGALKEAFRKQGRLEKASDILEKEIGRNQNNRAISLTDTIAAAGGLASGGGTPIALAAGAVNKAGRAFGNAMQARSFDAVSKLASKVPYLTALSKNNPVQFSVLAQKLFGPSVKNETAFPDILENAEIMKSFENDPSLLEAVTNDSLREKIRARITKRPH